MPRFTLRDLLLWTFVAACIACIVGHTVRIGGPEAMEVIHPETNSALAAPPPAE